MLRTIGVLLVVQCLVLCGVLVVKSISYDIHCGGHLKRAADANTVELAHKELKVAVSYLERHGMKSGYTSVIYRTPDEDIGFWYRNLNSSLRELERIRADASQLERSNVLMKLRETLLDHGQGGDSVTEPDGISRAPNNTGYAIGLTVSGILAVVGVLLFLAGDESRRY